MLPSLGTKNRATTIKLKLVLKELYVEAGKVRRSPQRPKTDLSKRFLPRPKTITA